MKVPRSEPIGINNSTQVPCQTPGPLLYGLYNDSIRNADNKILDQIKKTVSGTRSVFGIHIASYIIFFLLIIILQIYGLKRTFENQGDIIGICLSLISLLALFIIVYRNPMKELNHSILDLTKNQVVFLGFIREMNQIDIFFMQSLLEGSMDSKKGGKSLQKIQNLVDSYIESLTSLDDV